MLLLMYLCLILTSILLLTLYCNVHTYCNLPPSLFADLLHLGRERSHGALSGGDRGLPAPVSAAAQDLRPGGHAQHPVGAAGQGGVPQHGTGAGAGGAQTGSGRKVL